jgi:hypothetical protein
MRHIILVGMVATARCSAQNFTPIWACIYTSGSAGQGNDGGYQLKQETT